MTDRYHYVEWRHWDDRSKVAGDVAAVELYDRQTDPDQNINVANFKENKQLVARLSEQLERGWQSAVPVQ